MINVRLKMVLLQESHQLFSQAPMALYLVVMDMYSSFRGCGPSLIRGLAFKYEAICENYFHENGIIKFKAAKNMFCNLSSEKTCTVIYMEV